MGTTYAKNRRCVPSWQSGLCPRLASPLVGHETQLPMTRLATWIGEHGSESERKLRGKGCVCNRGGERHRPCDGASVRARGCQRGGYRCFGTRQSRNGAHDRRG